MNSQTATSGPMIASSAMRMPKNKGRKSRFSRWNDNLNLIFNHGGPGFCHFVITNRCDAHCRFCNFAAGNLKPEDLRAVSLEDGLLSIDILYDSGIRYIEFVGGEALLHREILSFVSHAHQKGMNTLICTHGGRLTPDFIHDLKEAGLNSIVISIDAPSSAVHEENRGIRNLCHKIRQANRVLRKVNIHSTASVTISRLISDYDKLPGFLTEMGFSQVTFSYPLQYLGSTYRGFSTSDLVHFSPQELITIFDKIQQLKKIIHIVNNKISIAEMQKFLRRMPQQFPCLGGYRYFLLDWNLDVYRCHFWETPMCNIHGFGPHKFIRDHCNLCMIDCYRDASVLQYIAVSLTDAFQAMKCRNFKGVYRSLVTKKNLLCLQAVAEQLRWITKL